MYRTHNCGSLRKTNAGKNVTLSGWVQRKRDKGGMLWIDLRDRYGITQLVFEQGKTPETILEKVNSTGREYVIKIQGEVIPRFSVNPNMPTGEIEILVQNYEVLNQSLTPPFTIEENTDGGEDIRMKYRYLDIRRNAVKDKLLLRHKMAQETRKYLDAQGFIEIETPCLIKSTPEGARDFVVPSRMNQGEFYALPQSPQQFKQLLMVAGMDKYFQIVRCFRDEDLRADRQPEFTQIDCEMSFIEQEDVLITFENMVKHLFSEVRGLKIEGDFRRMPYHEAMSNYGCDKPDLRFGMCISEMSSFVKGKGFGVFDDAEYIGGICAKACAKYTRKQLDELTEWVKRPQIGAKGLIYCRYNEDGTIRSSVDKFYSEDDLKVWVEAFGAEPGDIILVLAGKREITLKGLGELRLEMANREGLRNPEVFVPLWVTDFPLLEWDDETQRFYAKHHPFTAPKPEDIGMLDSNPAEVRANAYDMVINGVEVGGGSIRIYNQELQKKMFSVLGFSDEEAEYQFGFLMNAFRYGAPPHGGIAFGFDRLCSLFGGSESIRDYIAFPKNNSGRDVMADSPSKIAKAQLDELGIQLKAINKE